MQKSQHRKKPFNKSNIDPKSKRIQKHPKPDLNKKVFNNKAKKNQKDQQETTETPQVTPSNRVEALYQKAKSLYEQREKQILDKQGNRGDSMLMKKIMDSGTLADRVAALTIRVKEHPKFCIDSVVKLLMITKAESKRKNLMSVDALKDLFLKYLLEDRKLNTFSTLLQQKENPTNDELVAFYLEHRIKDLYMAYLKTLENGLRHDLDFFKDNSTRILGELLKSKPEQENTILSLLVNKFGDKNKKYITTLNKVLQDVLFRHKSMVIVVSKEIENFILRANNNNDAVFYALNFISMLNFEALKHETLMYLSKLFFNVFFKFTEVNEQENEKIHRIQSILLKSLNKIFPLIKELDTAAYKAIEEHVDQLFKMSHQCTLRVRIQALILLYQFLKSGSSIPDRFYRVVYELLLDEELKTNTSCQQFFDVLYNALKEDYSLSRVKAFLKRILQVATHAEAPFAISSLLLIAKILQAHPGALSLLNYSEQSKFSQEDEEEVFRDVEDPDAEPAVAKKSAKSKAKEAASIPLPNQPEEKKYSSIYDAEKREPLYANADNSYLFELLVFKEHYHPTVRLYASKMLEGFQRNKAVFDYNGNPWLDHSLSNFLDRISFKKPKKIGKDNLQNKMRLSKLAPPVSETFASGEDIREDEEYFVKYFQNRVPREKKGASGIGEEEEMDAYADKIFEQQLRDAEGPDGEDDEDIWEDEDFEEEDEDEGPVDDDEGETFEGLLEGIGEDEDGEGFDEEF